MSNYNPQTAHIQSNIQQADQLPQNNVIYVTVSPNNLPANVQISAKSHRSMAILEFITVFILLALEVVALCIKHEVAVLGTGIWFVVFILITGLLGYFGAKNNDKCLIISCMIMAIITCCGAAVALSMYSIELSIVIRDLAPEDYITSFRPYYYYRISCRGCAIFIQVKNIIGIVAAIFILILTIVQSAFCCKDVCYCCRQCSSCCKDSCCCCDNRAQSQSGVTTDQQQHQQTIAIQLQQMQPAGYSVQQTYLYPQQQENLIAQPSQVAYPMQPGSSYPQPSQVYLTQFANNPTQPSHDNIGASGDLPPSYQDAAVLHNYDTSKKI